MAGRGRVPPREGKQVAKRQEERAKPKAQTPDPKKFWAGTIGRFNVHLRGLMERGLVGVDVKPTRGANSGGYYFNCADAATAQSLLSSIIGFGKFRQQPKGNVHLLAGRGWRISVQLIEPKPVKFEPQTQSTAPNEFYRGAGAVSDSVARQPLMSDRAVHHGSHFEVRNPDSLPRPTAFTRPVYTLKVTFSRAQN